MTTGKPGVLRTVQAGGRSVELRYMEPGDATALLAFARSLQPHDLLFLATDITEVEGVNTWVDDILYGQVAVILAVAYGAVVGFSSVVRSPTRWMRHIGELRVVVGEAFRGVGLGRHLTAEAFRIAADMGVTRMVAQMTMDQLAAIRTFRRLGFTPMALLPGHVVDEDGRSYDLMLMHQEVASFAETLSHLE
ncbi:MAG: GNAT family N-acetyltransferase [Chloroflexi bacterium]|nr:GNAT family N-acetyltransferase [Chloroflexota bacterium]